MHILIVGGGGREHALAWKIAQSPRVSKISVAPGNAGTCLEAKTVNISLAAEDRAGLLEYARSQNVALTVVGPEAPLVAGIVDEFTAAGLRCFGPDRAAAILEGSKSFTKDFLQRHQIPTAPYRVFTDVDAAIVYIRSQSLPIVIKADGLAAGKGVVIAHTHAEAIDAARTMLQERAFGNAGAEIVVEGFLSGEEASFIVITDGEHVMALAGSQDHKARDDGDRGPNTGGMGAYSPAPVLDADLQQRVMQQIVLPTVRGMAAEGRRYRGFLYAGLMIDSDGNPQVLEYNCRLGDPETQVILLRLQSDLVDLCCAALDGTLSALQPQWDSRAALGVVMTAAGYPAGYRKQDVISGLDVGDRNTMVFHAGTECKEGRILTTGGRVLAVCALGDTVAEAQRLAYQRVKTIHWQGAYARSDIGYRAVAREARPAGGQSSPAK